MHGWVNGCQNKRTSIISVLILLTGSFFSNFSSSFRPYSQGSGYAPSGDNGLNKFAFESLWPSGDVTNNVFTSREHVDLNVCLNANNLPLTYIDSHFLNSRLILSW